MNVHYKAVHEGINRARLIRKDLKNTLTEYYPEKVRGLNRAYIDTVKEIVRQGDMYIDMDEDFNKGLEVAMIVENYKAFLSTINIRDK
jgi:hypothetical protein